MTIQFNCPSCDAVIAFDAKHRGKRAKCTTCGQRFVIPLFDGEKARKIKPPPEEKADTIPGFYRSVFVDSWKLFTTPENLTGLVFIATAVCLKFFTANLNFILTIPGEMYTVDLPIMFGHVLHAATWGFLFWYYMEIIYATAFERDTLPELIVGGPKGLVAIIARSLYMCFIALLVVALPFFVYVVISELTEFNSPALMYVLVGVGIFLLPVAIVTLAVGKDLKMLRPDYFLITIFGSFGPYLVTVILLGVAGAIQTQASQYDHQSAAAVAWHLALNLAVQAPALVAMRSIGLFYRHCSGRFAW